MSPAMLRRLALLGAILPTLAMASTLVPGGTLTVNTTWNLAGSPYIVQGDLYVYGSTAPRLTIEPGVEVRFQPGAGLFISYNGYENVAWMGELHAVGTALDPILFTANNGNSGGWEGVVIGNNADTGGSTSQFQHAIIEKAIRNLALHNTTQPATLANLELRDASDEGLFLLGVSTDPALSNLSIHDNADFSVLLNGSQLPAMNAVTRTGNGEDRVAYTGIIEDDLTLDIAGYSEPVIFTGTTFVYGAANPRLTLTPGSELRFRTGARLTISYDSGENTTWRGQLTAVGTALDPIVFTADNGLSGGWNGLLIGNNADTGGATCQLEHCLIEKANRNLALHNTTQPATLANLELRDASDEGLFLLGVSTDPVLSNLSIHDNADFSVLLSGSPLPAMSGVTRTGNGEDRVAYTGDIQGDLTLDIAGYTEPVVFTGTTFVYGSANPRLTLTPGSELRFRTGARLTISYDSGENTTWRGQLTAVGTALDPIVFTADNGLSGGWNGLLIGNNADTGGATCQLEHCLIEKATRNLALHNTTQPATLANLELRDASDEGLFLLGVSTDPVLSNLSIHDNADFSVLLSGSPLPAMSGVTRTGNGEDRVAYTGQIEGDLTLDIVGYPEPVVFTGTTFVYGSANPRLTLTAGSELRFMSGARLTISYDAGDNNVWRGQLTAVGTALDPILFTADNGLSGGWNGLLIGNNADTGGATCQLEHCLIEKATRNLALHNTTQPATLANLELRDASDEGLFLMGVSTDPVLSNLSIHDNADFSVLLSGSPLPAMSGVTRTGNGEDRVAYTGQIEGDLTLDIAGYSEPVVFTGTTHVYGPANPRLTLTAGSELRFMSGARLNISYDAGENNVWRGQLTAVGTALDPIVFTADNGLSGGWNGLQFGGNADTGGATCQLEYCLIEMATRNLALHDTTQPATLANLELRDASDEGLFLLGVSTDPALSNLSIHDNADFSVLLSGSPLPAMSAVTRTGNGENRVAYTGQVEGDLTLDIAGYSEPVVFTGTTYVFGSANPRLTLTAGSELRFAPGASLRISYDTGNNNAWRGQLTAQGSASDPIVFTADDGLSGGWNGITFGNNADFGGAVSSMEHCRIELAGENLVFSSTNQPDTLRQCQLGAALTNGLRLTGSYPLVANCTFEDNATAIRLENSATTTIGNSLALSNSFLGNSTWYLYNNGAGDVDARYNGWCTSDGFTPSDRIWDEVDDPAKGLVTYLPASEVNVLRISIDYHAAADSFHFEWCPVVGALSYNLYSSPEPGWPINAMGTLIANTTDSWLDLPRSALPDRLFFYATAEIPVATARSGGCR